MSIALENPIAYLAQKVEGSLFGDKRLDKRAIAMVEAMVERSSIVIRQFSKNAAEQKAYQRFLRNPEVAKTTLVDSLQAHCAESAQGKHVLALNDTTELNLQAHAKRLSPEQLGVIGDGKSLGFFLHPTLVLEAESGDALGFSSVQSWCRAPERADKHARNYKQQAIEEKESYKWIRAAQETKAALAEADMITMIADRESDIYEEFVTVPDEKTHLLVRSRCDRCLEGSEEKLYATLAAQVILGRYSLEVEGDERRGRKRRQATLEVRCCEVRLKRPQRVANSYPDDVKLYAIEAKECAETISTGEEGIHWRLLTTHVVDDFDKALTIVRWYAWRFFIEQLFRTLKRQGLDLEASQLEKGEAILKLAILALHLALKVMQLVRAREGSEQAAELVFDQQEQACLQELAPTLEGNTPKQRNPHSPHSLAWAAWLIARLGGWNGYASERPPGVITMHRGLKQFEALFLGWQLARNPQYEKDVYPR
jgi:hypothetical protein